MVNKQEKLHIAIYSMSKVNNYSALRFYTVFLDSSVLAIIFCYFFAMLGELPHSISNFIFVVQSDWLWPGLLIVGMGVLHFGILFGFLYHNSLSSLFPSRYWDEYYFVLYCPIPIYIHPVYPKSTWDVPYLLAWSGRLRRYFNNWLSLVSNCLQHMISCC